MNKIQSYLLATLRVV